MFERCVCWFFESLERSELDISLDNFLFRTAYFTTKSAAILRLLMCIPVFFLSSFFFFLAARFELLDVLAFHDHQYTTYCFQICFTSFPLFMRFDGLILLRILFSFSAAVAPTDVKSYWFYRKPISFFR